MLLKLRPERLVSSLANNSDLKVHLPAVTTNGDRHGRSILHDRNTVVGILHNTRHNSPRGGDDARRTHIQWLLTL